MTTRDDMLQALQAVDLFADLSPKELGVLADCLRAHSHADGERIVIQGDGDGRFYIVTEGTVTASADGKELASFGPGQYFGEISLLDRGPRTATVTANGPAATLSAASFAFRPVLMEHPDMMLKLLVKLCGRVRALDKRVVH